MSVATLLSGCSDLIGDTKADVVLELEADDEAQVLRTRQEVLASAPTWSGTRVVERTSSPDESVLEFTLPGGDLDLALSSLGQLDARLVTTEIDVDPEQLDRTPPTTATGDGPAGGTDPGERTVRLRVLVKEASPAGVGPLLQLVMAVFSLVGMVATVGWVLRWWRDRGDRALPPRRRIERLDLREDPPTEETPRVPPQW